MSIRADSALCADAWPRRGLQLAWLACVAAPWLSPRASGPSASVDQWLLTGFTVACMVALSAWRFSGDPGVQQRLIRDAVAAGWLLAALLSTVIAFCQYFGMADHFPGIMSATATGEPFANLRQRNQFASLTVMGTAILLWFSGRGLPSAAAMAGVIFLAVGNAAAASRAGALELLMVFALACAWPGPDRARAVKLSFAGVVAYLLAGPLLPLLADMVPQSLAYGVLGRLGRDEGCASRAVLWSNVLTLIAQKPLLGWGWGNLDYAHYMTLYAGPRFCDVLDNAHNLPLQLAVELGIPASVAVCAAAAGFTWRHAPWREQDPARRAAWSVLGIIGIHSMVEYPLWYGPFLLAFVLCAGFVAMRPSGVRHDGRAQLVRNNPFWRLGFAASIGVAAAFGAWQYQRASQIYLPSQQRLPAYRDDTLNRIRDAWLFKDQIRFAELTTTPLTAANARWTLETARELLHFSPEPRVIEKVIESAMLLKQEEEATAHIMRFRAAFPKEYASWLKLRS